jgi:small subunit ribosomal protein S8
MNNQDPIADMLTRIRNANRVGRRMVLIPKSKICLGIAQVLRDEGYIEEFDSIDDASHQGQIRVKLKYSLSGDKVIHVIDRASKPGCRVYRGVEGAAAGPQRHGYRRRQHQQGRHERPARPASANVGGDLLCVVS